VANISQSCSWLDWCVPSYILSWNLSSRRLFKDHRRPCRQFGWGSRAYTVCLDFVLIIFPSPSCRQQSWIRGEANVATHFPCIGLPSQYWKNPGPLVSCESCLTIRLLPTNTSSYSSRTWSSWPFLGPPSWNNLRRLLHVRNGDHYTVGFSESGHRSRV
jgi:hypothetical protein